MRVPATIVVNAAAILLESAPFVLAGAICLRLPFLRLDRFTAYLGCGCEPGPSARSLPAAVAAWLAFGPFVALARLGAAILVDRLRPHRACTPAADSALSRLAAVVPCAFGGAAIGPLLPSVLGAHAPPAILFAFGALAGAAAAPCALGAVALAAVMRGCAPAAAAGFLCVAGIADARAWTRVRANASAHDMLAYALAASACALAAARGGFVSPKIAIALWPCAAQFGWLAYRYRFSSRAFLRIAPMVMLAGCVLSAPPPRYAATETTLSDAFPGERLDFTGQVTRTGNVVTLVRYAITCCRADAAPIAVRLNSPPTQLSGWVRARGTVVQRAEGLQLRAESLQAIAAPADPFVYR